MLNCQFSMDSKKLINFIFEFKSKCDFLVKSLLSFLIVFEEYIFFIS